MLRSCRQLHAAAGETGGNPQTGRRVRKLGIPTALDRFVQQAVMQVLQRQWDPTFSDSSYGFRPGRSTHQAVAQAQQYIAAGYGWVDLDLEKFFDRVNYDKLMSHAKRIGDKRLLKLIRAFLSDEWSSNFKRRCYLSEIHMPRRLLFRFYTDQNFLSQSRTGSLRSV
jgi:retron-type reverse transcriptase